MNFEGAIVTDNYGQLPVFSHIIRVSSKEDSIWISDLQDLKFEELGEGDLNALRDTEKIPADFTLSQNIIIQHKVPYLSLTLLPLRKNTANGKIERLISFGFQLNFIPNPHPTALKTTRTYADHSVLASGTWYKMSAKNTGIYRITYDDLKNMGVNVSAIDPRNIRIYGNGGGMLPEPNATRRIDDLRENAIQVVGEEDGKFDAGDYILFYGEAPDIWKYDYTNHIFHHSKNIYSDVNYYFLTVDLGQGKRVGLTPSTTQTPNFYVTTFNDYQFYEKDDINLIKSGKLWLDQQYFDVTTTRDYTFNFPNIDNVHSVTVTTDVAARSTTTSSSFDISANNQYLLNVNIPPVTTVFLDTYAVERSGTGGFNTADPVIDIKLKYNKPDITATGYLNYLELNVTRNLVMSGSQMSFRSPLTSGSGKVSDFSLTTGNQTVTIWDVTNGGTINKIVTSQNGSATVFRLPTDTLQEFIAFDGTSFLSATFRGKVDIQDLHGAGLFDYVIVTYPLFLPQAERLATFHRNHDQMSVFITTPEKIYNEFSSGKQDVTAIRDFMKMMYDRSGNGDYPKYLLLFGGASYDFKDRVQNNINFVPSFESNESLSPTGTFVSDDYFAILDDSEGLGSYGLLDLGIGRFPVITADQADEAVAKIEHYCAQSDSVKNDWRNVVCFVADDPDDANSNLHMEQAELLAGMITSGNKDYNVDKIFLDAYKQASTPGGARYPDVNAAINDRVDKGALIINYTGHGGVLGWAHERVLEIADIKSWKNYDRMPVFMTATCEFSWFDDPAWISAGEWVFLNSTGGGIALFTTTRPTFAGENFSLSTNFYSNVFKKFNGKFLKMGDLVERAKNWDSTGSSLNSRKFILLGDPGLQLAYPQFNVVTTAINGQNVSSSPDTLKALQTVTISGEVRDNDGNRMSAFNGTVFTTVFDKAAEIYTLGNDGGNPVSFYLQKNPLYRGKADVTEGSFSFTFIVPKDIAYNYGIGKISYYARDPDCDANGYNMNVIVGGMDNRSSTDEQAPEVRLFMNNTNFVSGGITDQNPVLLAIVSDSSGINTVGNGIGHDITAVVDDNTKESKILNDYYVSDINTFKTGIITYPFYKLSDGLHHLSLKVWDVYNNSSDATIEFIVASSVNFALEHLMTYPNPFSDHTTFSFESNQTDPSMDVNIKIFTINGKLIKTLHQVLSNTGYRVDSITWDGTDNDGNQISGGLYVYVLDVKLTGGAAVQKSSKLVYIR